MKANKRKRRQILGFSMIAMLMGMAIPNVYSIAYPNLTITAPATLPSFAGFEAYNPPSEAMNPDAQAPAIAEWTRSNGPGDTLALSGSGMPSDYAIYAPGYFNTLRMLDWFDEHGAATLPSDLPADTMYMLWPIANGLAGAPIAINQTESWWLVDSAHASGGFSIFGRNLGTDCKVWVEEKGQWLESVASNPYKADFVVPSNYANGTYTLWAHNGKGREYGFARALMLRVESKSQWDEDQGNWFDVTNYGAKGDGSSDDLAAFEAAIDAADSVAWSTVYIPAGNYLIGGKLDMEWNGTKIRLIGEDVDAVTIQPHSNNAGGNYILHSHGSDLQFKNLTLKANSNGGEQVVRIEKECERWLFENVRFDQTDAVMSYPERPTIQPDGTLTSDKILGSYGANDVSLINCEFIQKANLLFAAETSQVFVSNCTFIGSWDANTLLDIDNATGISIVDSFARNLDDSSSESLPEGWCQGRWIHGKGGFRDFYFSGNTTTNLIPRTGFSDVNVGEQVMFEFAKTYFRGAPTSIAGNTLTFASIPPIEIVGLVAVIQSGPGQGQNRVITGLSGSTITVDHDWRVEPTAESHVLIGNFAKNVAIYDNAFDGRSRALGSSFVGSAGIEAYGGCVDLVADKNYFHELRFPYNVQSKHATYDGRKDFEPNFFNLYMNGTIVNCYHGIAMYVEREIDSSWSVPQMLANVYRKNEIKDLAAEPLHYHGDFGSRSTSQQMDMQIFDANTYENYTGNEIEYVRITEAEVNNQITVEVSTLPPPPDPPPAAILTGIAISGPTSLDEETTAQYSCTASYSDGTTATVAATWSENSANASISATGELTAGPISADQSVTLTANFGGLSDTYTVSLTYVPPVLVGIVVSGAVGLDEETSSQYTCTANYSDGTSQTVTPAWSENSAYATISSSGVLSAGNVSADQSLTLSATYGGKTDAHNVTIHYVAPALTGIVISGSTSLNEETSAQYSCTATYSDGTSQTVTPSWSENSAYATISSSGVLSAGNVPADQGVTLSAHYGGKTDTHSVSIKYVAPVLSGIIISGPATLNEETSAQYVCTANYSDGTSTVVTPAWSENSTYTTISASGLLSAGNVSADQGVTISASYGGRSDTHSLSIKYVAPVLTGIIVSGAASLDEETTAQYTCTANYSDGTSQTVTPAWSENSAYATINTSGVLSAGNVPADQGVTLSANYGGKTDTHSVSIKYVAPVLSGIIVSGSVTLDEETTAQYSCTANYSDGTSKTVTPTWSENSAAATISTSGLLTAGDISADQGITITASYGGQSDTHSVNIKYVAPVLTGIVVSGSVTLDEETTAQYTCTANYSDGTSKTVTPAWSENSADATISPSGLLSAGDISADQTVVITASHGGQSDTHSVNIKYVAPVLTDLIISGPARMDEETSAQYVCTANYSDGTSQTVTPSWIENSSDTTISTAGVLSAGDVSTDQGVTLTASYGGQSDTHAVLVSYVVPPVVLSSITISGPGSMEENTSAQYSCTAHYSDGTSAQVTPTWSENSTFSSIDGVGLLGAGNVAADVNVTISASFEGKVDSQPLLILAIGDQVVFPLSGFEGKTVSAELWDESAQEWILLGEDFEPEEIVIENVNPDQWYWLGLYDELPEGSILMHGIWIMM